MAIRSMEAIAFLATFIYVQNHIPGRLYCTCIWPLRNKITLPRLPTHIFILVFILFVKKNSTIMGILFLYRLFFPDFSHFQSSLQHFVNHCQHFFAQFF